MDIYALAISLFFGAIFLVSVSVLWHELTREIEPYSKGD